MNQHPMVKWLNRYLGRPEVVALFAVLIFGYLIFVFFGKMLIPVFVSIVFAYLLQWPITKFEKWHVPHVVAVLITYLIFVGAFVIAIIWLLPTLWHQLNNLLVQLPIMEQHAQNMLSQLFQRYPQLISPALIQEGANSFRTQALAFGQTLLSFSLNSLSSLVLLSVYLVLVPLLVYFFLMDKTKLLNNFKWYLPHRRQLLTKVWLEFYEQIGHYVRGKFLEAVIVAVVFFIFFQVMGLDYASLMGVLVGLSVIIPYVGAVIVTVPVFIIGFLQWGGGAYFGYFVLIYGILIAMDANVLVPLIFAEAVSLHPVSIILAILIFGGLFGFWGVFFAIPLASLVKAVGHALESVSK